MRATNTSPNSRPISDSRHAHLQGNDLATFRTRVCESHRNGTCQDADRCPHSHCQTWQRRNPVEFTYSAKLCPEIEFVKKGNKMTLVRRCSRGRGCMFAHSKEEELYHPNMYKTKFCNSHPHCNRYFCPFAHSTEELRAMSKSASPATPPLSSPSVVAAQGADAHHVVTKMSAKIPCPGSPMSSATTASSSTVASPVLASQSPAAMAMKAYLNADIPPNHTSFVLECDGADAVELAETQPGYTNVWQKHSTSILNSGDDLVSGSAENRLKQQQTSRSITLTQEEARIYSDILVSILQREGLTSEERDALDRYKEDDMSFLSTCASPPPGAFEPYEVDQGGLKGHVDNATRSFGHFSPPPGLASGLVSCDDSPISEGVQCKAHYDSVEPTRTILDGNIQQTTRSNSVCIDHRQHPSNSHWSPSSSACFHAIKSMRRFSQPHYCCHCLDRATTSLGTPTEFECWSQDFANQNLLCCSRYPLQSSQHSSPDDNYFWETGRKNNSAYRMCTEQDDLLNFRGSETSRSAADPIYGKFTDSNSHFGNVNSAELGSDSMLLLSALNLLDSTKTGNQFKIDPNTIDYHHHRNASDKESADVWMTEVLNHVLEIPPTKAVDVANSSPFVTQQTHYRPIVNTALQIPDKSAHRNLTASSSIVELSVT